MEMRINDNITALYDKRTIQSGNNPVTHDNTQNPEDGKSDTVKKALIGACSVAGVMASLAILSKFDKHHKYTINPRKIFSGNLKDSYIMKANYKTKEIVTMGAGSIIGGLIGGRILDDKSDFNAKLREGIIQICNITFPIALVEGLSVAGKTLSEKAMPNWSVSKNILKKAVTKIPATIGAAVGLVSGMYIGNRTSNKLNEKVFKVKDDRPIKWTDFSAHVDDIGVAATFIADEKNPVTRLVRRIIPLALIVPGYETGIKKKTV